MARVFFDPARRMLACLCALALSACGGGEGGVAGTAPEISATVPAARAGGSAGDGRTQYPIVLVHGLFGFDTVAWTDYFFGVPAALRADGATVYVAQVSATESNEVRGEQLLAQVRDVLARTGAGKVNLIGHSQGSPTARYVAGVAPELVASVTSVGGVNKGSKVADILRGDIPPGLVTGVTYDAIGVAYGLLVDIGSGGKPRPQRFSAALDSLTTAGSLAFNRRFPQGVPADCGDGEHVVDGIRYYSWTGIQPATNLLDPSDPPLVVLSAVFGEPNDGLVAACSSRLGQHLGDYRQNHFDEIDQVTGLRDFTDVDPVTLYREHANRLKLAGL